MLGAGFCSVLLLLLLLLLIIIIIIIIIIIALKGAVRDFLQSLFGAVKYLRHTLT